jgi:hypothetical protein
MQAGGVRFTRPGLNRFLSRDMYNGALADLNLTTNPFTGNRYAFGAGNPISNVELDGHIPDDCARGEIRCTADDAGHWTVTERTSSSRTQSGTGQQWRRAPSGRTRAEAGCSEVRRVVAGRLPYSRSIGG